MSCGDDDKPFIPELNKLTSVTCTKNENAFFNANITYDQDKQINRIILNTEGNQFTDNYIIVDKTISVSGVKMIDGSPTNPFVHTVYTLSGNMIAAKERKFKAIVVYRLDRISRNISDFSSLIEELGRLGLTPALCHPDHTMLSLPKRCRNAKSPRRAFGQHCSPVIYSSCHRLPFSTSRKRF